MTRRRNPFLAFLRSPAQWTMMLCTAAVVLFLQLFGTWNLKPDVFGQMYYFMKVFVWLGMAIAAALLLHFGFDRLTDWLARSDDSHTRDKQVPPAALFPRN